MLQLTAKTWLTLVLLLAFAAQANAEYGGYILKYAVKTKLGEEFIAYSKHGEHAVDRDSLSSQAYILHTVFGRGIDSLLLYTQLLRYDYQWFSENTYTEHALYDAIGISKADIDLVQVLDVIAFSYMSNIAFGHTLNDTTWMKQAPVDTAGANGYFCNYYIFVHEKNDVVDRVMADLRDLEKSVTDLKKQWREARKKGYNTEVDRLNKLLDALENDDLDDKMFDIIKQMEGYKVVVIQFCSC